MLDFCRYRGLIVVFVVMPRPRESSTGTYNVRQIYTYRIIASSSGPAPTLLVTHRITWRRKKKQSGCIDADMHNALSCCIAVCWNLGATSRVLARSSSLAIPTKPNQTKPNLHFVNRSFAVAGSSCPGLPGSLHA
jgi:hypothetical protein